jgi:hypothetical protein
MHTFDKGLCNGEDEISFCYIRLLAYILSRIEFLYFQTASTRRKTFPRVRWEQRIRAVLVVVPPALDQTPAVLSIIVCVYC